MAQNEKMYPHFNKRKATEATSLLLSWHGGRMSKIKLLKLLYIADRKALQRWERPITFDRYYSMKEGQVLSGVLDLINGRIEDSLWNEYIERPKRYSIKLRDELIELKKMTRGEVKLLKAVYDEFGKLDRFDLAAITKNYPEYKPTNTSIITHIDEILTNIHGKENVNRIREKLEEQAYLEIAIGE